MNDSATALRQIYTHAHIVTKTKTDIHLNKQTPLRTQKSNNDKQTFQLNLVRAHSNFLGGCT